MTESQKAMREMALSLVGCGYIFGATGWVCTEKRLQQQADQYPKEADKILKYGRSKWMGKRCFDCATLTREIAKAGGFTLVSGATSQWDKTPWKFKQPILYLKEEPMFLYRANGEVMEHTGFYIGDGEFIDARGSAYGVLRSNMSSYRWTHCSSFEATDSPMDISTLYPSPLPIVNGDFGATTREEALSNLGIEVPVENPFPAAYHRLSWRQGDRGYGVREVQRCLGDIGYPVTIDGVFGGVTAENVRAFQLKHNLKADGIVGKATWAKIDEVLSR